jgi:hypothetical protein
MANTGKTKNRPNMRSAKMLANEALARRSVALMSKGAEKWGCKVPTKQSCRQAAKQRRHCPRSSCLSAKNSAGGDNRRFC